MVQVTRCSQLSQVLGQCDLLLLSSFHKFVMPQLLETSFYHCRFIDITFEMWLERHGVDFRKSVDDKVRDLITSHMVLRHLKLV